MKMDFVKKSSSRDSIKEAASFLIRGIKESTGKSLKRSDAIELCTKILNGQMANYNQAPIGSASDVSMADSGNIFKTFTETFERPYQVEFSPVAICSLSEYFEKYTVHSLSGMSEKDRSGFPGGQRVRLFNDLTSLFQIADSVLDGAISELNRNSEEAYHHLAISYLSNSEFMGICLFDGDDFIYKRTRGEDGFVVATLPSSIRELLPKLKALKELEGKRAPEKMIIACQEARRCIPNVKLSIGDFSWMEDLSVMVYLPKS